jgi:N-acetylglucosaminyl-diphospho-decaprenol L-rhamnosyltransferase
VFQARGQILVLPEVRVTHLSRGSVKGTRPWLAEYGRGFHHAQSKILFHVEALGAPTLPRRLRRRVLAASVLNVLARILLPSPRHLARAWGRFRGLRALKIEAGPAPQRCERALSPH